MKPILFSTPMVEAIFKGVKTQTRRIVKSPFQGWISEYNKNSKWFDGLIHQCPYGQVGDAIWVRETWQHTSKFGIHPSDENSGYIYKASENGRDWEENTEGWTWRPSIFMPKEACRLILKIDEIGVERLHDMTEEDAKSEGVEEVALRIADQPEIKLYRDYLDESQGCACIDAKTSFRTLWKSINGKESWDSNPFVWVIKFNADGR